MYKLLKDNLAGVYGAVKFNEDSTTTSFIFDSANSDYQAYLKFLEEGGQPLPPDEGEA